MLRRREALNCLNADSALTLEFIICILNLQEESPKNNLRERISSFGKLCLSQNTCVRDDVII